MGKFRTFIERVTNQDIPPISELNNEELETATRVLRKRFLGEISGTLLLMGSSASIAFVEGIKYDGRYSSAAAMALGSSAVGLVSFVFSCIVTGTVGGVYSNEIVNRQHEEAEAMRQANLAGEAEVRANAIISQIPSWANNAG